MVDFTFAHREEGFDEHIDKSIRGYQHLLNDVISLSRYFIELDTNVYDIGCSTGKVTEALIRKNEDILGTTYYGIEIADGFVDAMQQTQTRIKKNFHIQGVFL